MAQSAKDRWNAAHYRQLKISAPPDVVESFKSACAANDDSMASAIVRFMREYSDLASKTKSPRPGPTATRRLRRKRVGEAIGAVSGILDAESAYLGRIPENLQGGDRFADAEHSVEALEAALDALNNVYG
jgi:hypothetical protein